MATQRPSKRPTGLVSDSRERIPQRRPAVRFISVDNVLAGGTGIQSGQQRLPPGASTGRGMPETRGRNIPTRSTKLSEKLVLLPDTDKAEPLWSYGDTAAEGPFRDDEAPARALEEEGQPRKTYAERLPKETRSKTFARVTAYCTADAYRLGPASDFFKSQHLARTKLYDECLYVAYHLPLMPGTNGYRVRSSPVLKNPGGKPVLDVHLEESERADYHFFGQSAENTNGEIYTPGSSPSMQFQRQPSTPDDPISHYNRRASTGQLLTQGIVPQVDGEGESLDSEIADTSFEEPRDKNMELVEHMKGFAEMFVFSYGVVVFWNFTEKQEKDILGDMTFASSESRSETRLSLIRDPLKEQEFETEEFHFEYSPHIRTPRIFNDMITLRSGDMMVKLAISHAIAQSTKLCRFEERMSKTMLQAQHIPKRMALTGNLGMKREDVNKLSGKLFRLRVDVNLSSNILDVPEFFWDSEPTLHPLYNAVREYLEIKHRITVLNERCRVFLDLAELLADSIADANMSGITWIIIILICISILVTGVEVVIRFALLSGSGKGGVGGASTTVQVLKALKPRGVVGVVGRVYRNIKG